ncbi:MAG TPA: hypothetical protein VFA76_04350 [Terriglobales bacterium]|nr:hypothetical protein [Terriglobales bacterium]
MIPTASLAIEVSELLPAKRAGAKFSGPQVSSFQEAVVTAAQQHYYSSPDAPPADVLVFFRNDWTRKRDVEVMAQALASFIRSNYPSGDKDCVTLQSVSRGVRDWVDGLSVVRILRASGPWQAGGAGEIQSVTYDYLAQRIADKDLLLPQYRRRWPGFQMWLLLSTRIQVLHSVYIPHDINASQFKTGFDKVLISCSDNGVLELQHNLFSSTSTALPD